MHFKLKGMGYQEIVIYTSSIYTDSENYRDSHIN